MRLNLSARSKKPIAVIDFETDPFLYGRTPEPFAVEFYSDTQTVVFWGEDCHKQLVKFLQELSTPHLIYAHNGGKFDFHFLHEWIEDKDAKGNPALLIIKSRIVKCMLAGHELRDSFAALPVPLRDFGGKLDIDYAHMEKEVREEHKAEILEYLHMDCVVLYNAVTAFTERFGRQLTIGGTAIKQIKKLHPFRNQNSVHDGTFRPFYHGGRVQCFGGGRLPGPWKLFDVNSMYPYAMKAFNHPINGVFDCRNTLPDSFDVPYFVRFRGSNRNAIPTRSEDGELVFNQEAGEFWVCSHELKIALEHDLVTIDKILDCWVSQDYCNFAEFVDIFSNEKIEAKRRGDVLTYVFSKLLMNSGYGRMGINPANFEDWLIHRVGYDDEARLEEGKYERQADYGDLELWARQAPIKEEDFCDVAIAASITSAARALLLEGLQYADTPIYCDTDSIICRDFHGDKDPYRLGAWDLEKTADYCAIGGKKLYALYNADDEVIKLSTKGGTLSLAEVLSICDGDTVSFKNDAPTFSLKRKTSFVKRRFRRTT